MHLVPPSPALFRLWGFEARLAQLQGRIEEAREGWLDVLAFSGYSQLPRVRAQALYPPRRLDFEMEAFARAPERLAQLHEEGLEPYLPGPSGRANYPSCRTGSHAPYPGQATLT